MVYRGTTVQPQMDAVQIGARTPRALLIAWYTVRHYIV